MISVILCTRDRFALAQACISSILSQKGDYEVLVIDQSAERKAYADDPRVRVVYSDRAGLSLARNIGIRAAKGDVLAFVDDETIVSGDFINALGRAFGDSRVDALAGKVLILGTTIPYSKAHADTGGFLSIFQWNRFMGGNIAVRRSSAERVGFFDEKLGAGTKWSSGEETDYFFRMKYLGFMVYYEPGVLLSHPVEEYGHSDESYRKKLYAYGKGNGALFAKHVFAFKKPLMLLFFLWSLVKPIIRILQHCLTLDMKNLNRQRSIFSGRLTGFVEAAGKKEPKLKCV